MEVIHPYRSRRRSVAPPQRLAGMAMSHGREVQHSADRSELIKAGASDSWPYVLHQHRTPAGAVRLPQLVAVGPVVGHEVQRVTDGGEVEGGRASRAGLDVLHQHGALSGPIALPQLLAVDAVVRVEIQGSFHVREELSV